MTHSLLVAIACFVANVQAAVGAGFDMPTCVDKDCDEVSAISILQREVDTNFPGLPKVQQHLQNLPGNVQQHIQNLNLPGNLPQNLQNLPGTLKQNLQNLPGTLQQQIQSLPPSCLQQLQDVPNNLQQKLQSIVPGNLQQVQNLPSNLQQQLQLEVQQQLQNLPGNCLPDKTVSCIGDYQGMVNVKFCVEQTDKFNVELHGLCAALDYKGMGGAKPFDALEQTCSDRGFECPAGSTLKGGLSQGLKTAVQTFIDSNPSQKVAKLGPFVNQQIDDSLAKLDFSYEGIKIKLGTKWTGYYEKVMCP